MTWTYNLGLLQSSQLPQVRFLIGDTQSSDQLLQDEEINAAIAAKGNTSNAAAHCCRSIAATFSRQVDSAVGDLRASFSQKAKAFLLLAVKLEADFALNGGAVPFSGGLTMTDKLAAEGDTDRVPPQFNIGMEDNFLPIGDSGNETLSHNR